MAGPLARSIPASSGPILAEPCPVEPSPVEPSPAEPRPAGLCLAQPCPAEPGYVNPEPCHLKPLFHFNFGGCHDFCIVVFARPFGDLTLCGFPTVVH